MTNDEGQKPEIDFRLVEAGGREYRFHPDDRLVGALDGEFVGWEVWEKTYLSRDGWVSLKIFDRREGVDRPVRRRVSTVGYSVSQGRMARNGAWHALCDTYGDVAAAVERLLRSAYPKTEA